MGIYFINHDIKIPIFHNQDSLPGKDFRGFFRFFFSSIRMSLPDFFLEGILKLSSPWRQRCGDERNNG